MVTYPYKFKIKIDRNKRCRKYVWKGLCLYTGLTFSVAGFSSSKIMFSPDSSIQILLPVLPLQLLITRFTSSLVYGDNKIILSALNVTSTSDIVSAKTIEATTSSMTNYFDIKCIKCLQHICSRTNLFNTISFTMSLIK